MAVQFNIKSMNLTASYQYNTPNTQCLCGKQLTESTIKDDIYQGECGHGYHKSCINQHIMIDGTCSFCQQEWKFSKNLSDNSVYLYKV